jgi:hypothetical protein
MYLTYSVNYKENVIMKKVFGFVLAALLMFSLAACNGGNALSGTFGSVSGGTEIIFSGRSFIYNTNTEVMSFAGFSLTGSPYTNENERDEAEARERERAIEAQTNTFRYYDESDEYEFLEEDRADDGLVYWRIYRRTQKGTYSLTDNEIEFVYSTGEIQVKDFARTENTITIDGERLTRK